jgi:two-component system chemotaxis response regulator CheY
MSVLVVDDEPCCRYSLTALLRKEGFEVIEADDGIDGYDIVQRMGRSIDLLLTDINMPRMDGIELAKVARGLYPHMPVLLMTGDIAFANKRGVRFDVLMKPFSREQLVQAIQELLPRHRDSTPSQVEICGTRAA